MEAKGYVVSGAGVCQAREQYSKSDDGCSNVVVETRSGQLSAEEWRRCRRSERRVRWS